MKKLVMSSIIFIINAVSLPMFGMESWHFKSGDYICNKLFKKSQNKSEPLPIVDALVNFSYTKDKDGNANLINDGYEFNPEKYTRLPTYCSKLDFLDRHWWPLSRKEAALLQFARVMAKHEKEWTSWYTAELQSENGLRMQSYKVEAIINDRETVLRQDQNSPHYKWCKITGDLEKQNPYLYIANAYENTAYHDELQFLQTQQHTMELYWNMKPFWEKILLYFRGSYKAYEKQHTLIRQEIEIFKNDNNRIAFTRSCMQSKNVMLIQQGRNAYKASQVRQME